MDRDLTAAVKAEVAKSVLSMAHLVTVYLDEYVIRITDYDRTIVWGADQWLPTGGLLDLGEVEESAELKEQKLAVTLSGIDQVYVALFLSQNYLHRTVTVHRALLTETGAVIADPHLYFKGTMDEPVLNESPDAGTSLMTVQVVSNLAGNGRSPGRHTNDSEQQVCFPGDRGFKFVSKISRDVAWGRKD